MYNLSVILGNVGSCSDRYMTSGYSKAVSVEELFERVHSIPGAKGVELVSNWHINFNNVSTIEKLLKDTGLKLVSIIPDNFGLEKWGKGSYSSKDAEIRKEAISETKEWMNIAARLNCDLLNLWPGQDGYDYMFTADYIKERNWLEESIRDCADYRKDIRLSLEYKPKEPRIRSYISNVYSTLLMVNEIKRDNVGITIDYGHSTMAYEKVAESIAILKKHGDKLFHMHMNDNYTLWDDDMIVGSVHTIGYLEMFYWLKKTEYRGWISTDQYPYREDSKESVAESILWMQAYEEVIDSIDDKEVEDLINKGDANLVSRFIRKLLFNK